MNLHAQKWEENNGLFFLEELKHLQHYHFICTQIVSLSSTVGQGCWFWGCQSANSVWSDDSWNWNIPLDGTWGMDFLGHIMLLSWVIFWVTSLCNTNSGSVFIYGTHLVSAYLKCGKFGGCEDRDRFLSWKVGTTWVKFLGHDWNILSIVYQNFN